MANYSMARQVDAAAGNTMSRRIYDVLKADIETGRLKPGARLVRKAVAGRLGVSTIPVIEAFYRLEIDGYVENLPLVGCRVRALTVEELDDDLMLREALECQAARLCAGRLSVEEGERLMRKARQVDRFIRADTPDATLGNQAHFEFHLEVGRLSGRRVFGELLKKVWFQRYMSLNSLKAMRFQSLPDGWHQILVRRLMKGDPDEAERAMREHVQFGRQDDRNALELYLRERVRPGLSR